MMMSKPRDEPRPLVAALLLRRRFTADQRTDFFAADGAEDVTVLAEIENEDRHVVLHAVGDRGTVHDAEIPLADGGVIQLAVQHGMRIPLGIVAIDAID